jgi:hypothetical protein
MLGKIKIIVPISILISIMIVYLVSLLMKPTLSAVVTGVLFNMLVVTVLIILVLQLHQSTAIKQSMKRFREYLLLSITPFCLFWLSFHFDEALDLSRRIDVDYMFFAIIFGVTIIYALTFIKLMKDWPTHRYSYWDW